MGEQVVRLLALGGVCVCRGGVARACVRVRMCVYYVCISVYV
jgi:hypothetical protein